MGWPVILTPQALEDLREIVAYIAGDNPERAITFGNELTDQALAIGDFPERGRVVPELEEEAVREVIYGRYRIIYELFHEARKVFILRFWHGARGTPETIGGTV
jgi:plasmid stabilization system protein ParE